MGENMIKATLRQLTYEQEFDFDRGMVGRLYQAWLNQDPVDDQLAAGLFWTERVYATLDLEYIRLMRSDYNGHYYRSEYEMAIFFPTKPGHVLVNLKHMSTYFTRHLRLYLVHAGYQLHDTTTTYERWDAPHA